jgi:hypothetical protein
MFGTALQQFARHPILAVGAVVSDPREAWNRFYDEYVYARERRRPEYPYEAATEWEERLHHFLGVS